MSVLAFVQRRPTVGRKHLFELSFFSFFYAVKFDTLFGNAARLCKGKTINEFPYFKRSVGAVYVCNVIAWGLHDFGQLLLQCFIVCFNHFQALMYMRK